jgi:NitT/TauT family transport system substrate-binding protein
VRHYASPESAFADLDELEKAGRKIRVVYVQDTNSGIKLLGSDAWFVHGRESVSGFLLKADAEAWARANGGKVLDFGAVKTAFSGQGNRLAAQDRQ